MGTGQFHPLTAFCGHGHAVTQLLKHFFQHDPVGGVVFHHQHIHRVYRLQGLQFWRLVWRGGAGNCQGQAHPKATARTQFTFHPNLAPHSLGQTAGNGQPKARAPTGADKRLIQHHKVFKYPHLIAFGDANAGVNHAHFDL